MRSRARPAARVGASAPASALPARSPLLRAAVTRRAQPIPTAQAMLRGQGVKDEHEGPWHRAPAVGLPGPSCQGEPGLAPGHPFLQLGKGLRDRGGPLSAEAPLPQLLPKDGPQGGAAEGLGRFAAAGPCWERRPLGRARIAGAPAASRPAPRPTGAATTTATAAAAASAAAARCLPFMIRVDVHGLLLWVLLLLLLPTTPPRLGAPRW